MQLRQDISIKQKRAGPSVSVALPETAGAAAGLLDLPSILQKAADAAIRTQNKSDSVMFEKRSRESLLLFYFVREYHWPVVKIKTPLRDYKEWRGYI